MADYPEHEKMAAIKDQADIVADFLEHLIEDQFIIAKWHTSDPCTMESSQTDMMGDPAFRCVDGTIVFSEYIHTPDRARRGIEVEPGDDCPRCKGTGWVERLSHELRPVRLGIEKLLAWHFDIDLDKISDEKDAMLAAIRKANG